MVEDCVDYWEGSGVVAPCAGDGVDTGAEWVEVLE